MTLKDKTFENGLLKTKVDELEKKSQELEFDGNQKAGLIKWFTDPESPNYYKVDCDGDARVSYKFNSSDVENIFYLYGMTIEINSKPMFLSLEKNV